ncbi:MAG: hypothetical protein Q4G27_11055 [Flavobacteriaceae bacterium]|nr:hypothetical protein [Flavobacteriaceae bacterium]
MKRFYFLCMGIIFTSILTAQEIWHRTYAGNKDAATDGLEDVNRNLYVVGSNGSGISNVISAEEPAFLEPSGAFVTKLNSDGHTLWYKTLTSNYNFSSYSRILVKNDWVYALFKNIIYKLKATDGSLEATYNLQSDGDNIIENNLMDFAIYEMDGETFLILVTNDMQNSYVKVIKDGGNSFDYQTHMVIDADKPGLEKIIMLGEQIYIGGLFHKSGNPTYVAYPSSGSGLVEFTQANRYLLFNYKLTYNNGNFGFTFNHILNDGITEDYPIDDFDIDKDPGLGEYLIYGTGRGTYDNKLFTVFADNFSFQNFYDVTSGKKETFTADEGNVYYTLQHKLQYASKDINLKHVKLDVSQWKKGYYYFKFQLVSGVLIQQKLLVK